MTPGIQTSFNARIPLTDLEAMRGFGFKWVRQDALLCDTPTMLGMIEDAESIGLRTLTILYDLDKLAAMPAGCWVEWGNELDFTLPARDYRATLDAAAHLAKDVGLHLVAPCISNLDRDSLDWCARVRGDTGWPAGMVAVSAHRYGDGRFAGAHTGFTTRADEVRALRELCDDLPYLITEFGYKTKPGLEESSAGFVTEADQAAYITQEWQFWEDQGALAALLYQINDGPNTDIEGFGIRRCNPDGTLGTWKPSAYVTPGVPT